MSYPKLTINLPYLKENVETIVALCAKSGIDVAGVIKGANGIPEVTQQFSDGGVAMIASSRLEQLSATKEVGVSQPLMLIRVPMLSELTEMVALCDVSLQSELTVLRATNAEAVKQDTIHKVILMADLGDLREGFWDKEEGVRIAEIVENELINLELLGVGTNVGCYGSIEATTDKLQELVDFAENIEAKIGRQLEVISGGATTSVMRLFDGNMPARINQLRIGEGILVAYDWSHYYGYDTSFMHHDAFTLEAEIIEVKNKPTFPVGHRTVDAFGHVQDYTDRGIRRRALAALGNVDVGSYEDLEPREARISLVGASSDHLILDVEEQPEIAVGDIVSFDLNYASLVFATHSANVSIEFVS